ncbi:hypothetical protein VRRI112168_14910 [Vreelandella rituensis]|uniref:Uncharacterized protein n=2 Tax=Vreelandella rituensis TaxID=2282306 RepID=A0A368UB39_9GAMM|nr:hypothetical protein DU506_01120 [Halomonas rituensis]
MPNHKRLHCWIESIIGLGVIAYAVATFDNGLWSWSLLLGGVAQLGLAVTGVTARLSSAITLKLLRQRFKANL